METTSNVLSIVPAQQVINAVDRVKILALIVRQLHDSVLVDGMDYGIIPGTGDKPTLLLPGMEKLTRALNAVPEYIERRVIVDYDKPLFHYEYECRLIDAETGLAIPGGRGLGLCTSMESSFRWRKAERTCPVCGQATIKRSKYAPRNNPNGTPGWWCANDACKTNFDYSDEKITQQQVGRVENPDIFDQVNAIMKRAKKRAMGDAVKGAANVSEYFTVDLEDLPTMHFDEPIIISTPTPPPMPAPEPEATPEAAKSQPLSSGEADQHLAESTDGANPGGWQYDEAALMKRTLTWRASSQERINTLRKAHAEGAFENCPSDDEAIKILAARIETHERKSKKVNPMDLPPDEEPAGEGQS